MVIPEETAHFSENVCVFFIRVQRNYIVVSYIHILPDVHVLKKFEKRKKTNTQNVNFKESSVCNVSPNLVSKDDTSLGRNAPRNGTIYVVC
jgi:hypothetical protein